MPGAGAGAGLLASALHLAGASETPARLASWERVQRRLAGRRAAAIQLRAVPLSTHSPPCGAGPEPPPCQGQQGRGWAYLLCQDSQITLGLSFPTLKIKGAGKEPQTPRKHFHHEGTEQETKGTPGKQCREQKKT